MLISSRTASLVELGFFKVEPKSCCVALTLLYANTYWKPTNTEQISIVPLPCDKALKQTRIFMHFLIRFHLQM